MTDMRDVDHTHPHTGEPFGDAFRRGVVVAADGGHSTDESDRRTDDTMDEVDHTPPTEGVTRSFERGTEGRNRYE
ncbi:MAG: hypothetical protein ABEH35_05465 [Haloarculaceae archaeon]